MHSAAVRVTNLDQLLAILDELFYDGSDWTRRHPRDHWADIFSRPDHPLNSDLPDANLVDWNNRGLLPRGDGRSALDIGAGLGRNTRWLARQGYQATGIDLSPYAVREAWVRSVEPRASFLECDVLREDVPGGPFDVVYDSGCFHHLPPHRRLSYLGAVMSTLKPGGLFGICTFASGHMGTEATDLELFRQGRLEGGIAYSLEDLKVIFSAFQWLDGGALPSCEAAFSMEFLHSALFRRPE